ncbi:pyridoxamine 5'-phosphate oxidase family protein [Candidatus Saccharibacteria bacterium]|nr:MAG: pyridoxamine 5'-phosphate oxidase family protein [Candidatus Saccharibacteria bacterium]
MSAKKDNLPRSNKKSLKEFFEANMYCTLSTVGEDGQPWASPLYFGFDNKHYLFVRFAKDAQYMKNTRIDLPAPDVSKFIDDGPRRVFCLRPGAAWVNRARMTDAGFMDWREEVPLT